MCKTPKKEHDRYKVECGILLKLIAEELAKNAGRPPDWADTGKILHVRNDLKKLLANMRLAPGSIEEEVKAEIEKEIAGASLGGVSVERNAPRA